MIAKDKDLVTQEGLAEAVQEARDDFDDQIEDAANDKVMEVISEFSDALNGDSAIDDESSPFERAIAQTIAAQFDRAREACSS